MRTLVIALLLAACGGKPDPMPPKRPNNELIVGEFERRHQEAHTAARFKGDGSVTLASKADELDSKAIAEGTYKLEGDKLTLVYTKGDLCESGVEGTYTVVISKVGIRFTKIDDACERRAKIDGETWYRR
jgi:uncharacterized protein (TIGR03066 family)